MKHYNGFEGHQYRISTIEQVHSARALGCTVGAYVWCFNAYSPEQTFDDAYQLAADAGEQMTFLWADCEVYNDTWFRDDGPQPWWMRRFIARAESKGVEIGIYTGGWWWTRYTMQDTDEFKHHVLWDSNYTGVPHLVPANYGGWQDNTVATQWWDKPYDQSLIRSDYARI